MRQTSGVILVNWSIISASTVNELIIDFENIRKIILRKSAHTTVLITEIYAYFLAFTSWPVESALWIKSCEAVPIPVGI